MAKSRTKGSPRTTPPKRSFFEQLGRFVGISFGVFGAVAAFVVFSHSMGFQKLKNLSKAFAYPQEKRSFVKREAKQFDFYTLLPGTEVELPKKHSSSQASLPTHPTHAHEQAKAQDVAKERLKAQENKRIRQQEKQKKQEKQSQKLPAVVNLSQTNREAGQTYLIHAGTFRRLLDAKQLKKQLFQKGFTPEIQTLSVQKGGKRSVVFRVILGPYAAQPMARYQQKRLERYQIPSKIIVKKQIRSK